MFTDQSVIDLNSTIDPELKQTIQNISFLLVITLTFLYIFKFFFLLIIFLKAISEEDQIKEYPTPETLRCEILGSLLMIATLP
jgi:hypothetical protein